MLIVDSKSRLKRLESCQKFANASFMKNQVLNGKEKIQQQKNAGKTLFQSDYMKDIKKIDEDIKSALKARNEDALTALRLLKTAIINKEKELRRELEVSEALQVVNTLSKQRRDSIEQYDKFDRKDLADKERAELKVLQEYLPPTLSEEELIQVIKQVISESGATNPKEMGAVMKAVMVKVAGCADGKHVSSLVVKLLQSK